MATGLEDKKLCIRCNKLLRIDNFYKRRDGTHLDLCKKCIGGRVDVFDPETFLYILKDLDVPYLEAEWNDLINKIIERGQKVNASAILGKYVSKMKLRQWKEYGWDDSETLEKERKAQIEAKQDELSDLRAKMQIKFENGEISRAEYETYQDQSDNYQKIREAPPTDYQDAVGRDNHYQDGDFLPEEELPDPANELTKDDKVMLAMKWGRTYKASQWIALEKKYQEMKASFDISDSDTEGTLILICKTYLKMNEAIDSGDMESYGKLSRTYDTLRKSAKFTAAQKKEEGRDFINCIGELVVYCERKGGKIPRYEINVDRDIVDTIIRDQKEYVKNLVYEDTTLATQIEAYLKKREAQDKIMKSSNDEEDYRTEEDYIRKMEEEEREREHDLEESLGEA